MASEFDLIARYFTRATPSADLGPGDDAALLTPRPGMQWAVSTDMLVEGTHFLPDTDPRDLGWKALAVNVSDIAAMGAQPRWATLALALPDADESWIGAFADGFFECADQFGVELIGGDTTRGPRNLSVTIMGEVPVGQALRRDGARPGDVVWVSGQPGRAALGLAHLQGRARLSEPALGECLRALHHPQPRVELGLALRGLASAAIDISDGLLADLGHILLRSGVSARLQVAVSPVTEGNPRGTPTWMLATYLSGGDDYELLFTAPPESSSAIAALGFEVTRLGVIEAGPPGELHVTDSTGHDITPGRRGYDHFG